MKRGKGGVSGIVVVFPTVRVGIRAVQYTHITTKRETNFFLPLVHSTHRACSACTSLIRRRAVGGDGERIGWQGPNTNERRRRSATASSQQPVVDPGRRCNHPTPPPPLRVWTGSRHTAPCRQVACTMDSVHIVTGGPRQHCALFKPRFPASFL